MSSRKPHVKQPRPLRKRPAATALALGLSTAVLVPMAAVAQEQKGTAESTLQPVNVIDTALEANPNAEPGVPYKAKYSGDERHKRALAETAQNIQVLTKAQIVGRRHAVDGAGEFAVDQDDALVAVLGHRPPFKDMAGLTRSRYLGQLAKLAREVQHEAIKIFEIV